MSVNSDEGCNIQDIFKSVFETIFIFYQWLGCLSPKMPIIRRHVAVAHGG